MNLDSTTIVGYRNESRVNETNELTFHNACAQCNLNVVKFFLSQQEFDMNVGDNQGRTGFHLACQYGSLNVVQFLLQQGFDMNLGDNKRRTGFHHACRYGNFNVVQFLVQQEFDMNIGDRYGITGFHLACAFGKLNAVQVCLQQGFDWNVGDNDGNNGFHIACGSANLNVVQFLVQKGFEGINEPGYGGITGLEMLVNYRYDDEIFMPCILLLIEAGAKLYKIEAVEELISAVQNRIIEITFMEQAIFEKWTGRIARAITDFTMGPRTRASLHNLSHFLD